MGSACDIVGRERQRERGLPHVGQSEARKSGNNRPFVAYRLLAIAALVLPAVPNSSQPQSYLAPPGQGFKGSACNANIAGSP